MSDESLDLSDLMVVIRRRKRMLISITACTALLFLLAAMVIPKKYKSTASITIYTKYFQNPLVKDFLPEIYDNTELKSQRETLIRKAFDSDFLNSLGEKYHIFKTSKVDPRHSIEEFELFKRIEVFSLESTTFSISFIGDDAAQTLQVMDEIVKRVTDTLADERKKTIVRLRDSIRKRIEDMALTMESTTDPLASVRPELLHVELDRLNAQISALKTQYTEKHPTITKLAARAALIKKWLDGTNGKAGNSATQTSMPLVGGEPKDPNLVVYSDLLKKMNYLNIVLEMEDSSESAYVGILQAPVLPESPVFPKKGMFLFWGLLSGVMLSMLVLLSQEYLTRAKLSAEEFSQSLGLDYFGPLPIIQWKAGTGSSQVKKSKAGKEGQSLDGWQ